MEHMGLKPPPSSVLNIQHPKLLKWSRLQTTMHLQPATKTSFPFSRWFTLHLPLFGAGTKTRYVNLNSWDGKFMSSDSYCLWCVLLIGWDYGILSNSYFLNLFVGNQKTGRSLSKLPQLGGALFSMLKKAAAAARLWHEAARLEIPEELVLAGNPHLQGFHSLCKLNQCLERHEYPRF